MNDNISDLKKTGTVKLDFSDKAIENFNPNEDSFLYKDINNNSKERKQIHIPFNVPKRSPLKGLQLGIYKATKTKVFILNYWHNNKSNRLTIGFYVPKIFGVKQASEKLFRLYNEHTENTIWVKDPKISKRLVTKNQLELSKKKTICEVIEQYALANFPKIQRGGHLQADMARKSAAMLFGYNKRFKLIKFTTNTNSAKTEVIFKHKFKGRGQAKLNVHPESFMELFKKFPPGQNIIPGEIIECSIYDSPIGKTLLETLTKGDIQRLISKHTYGTQKQLINCINNIWYFAINSGLLGDNPPVNPTKDYKINKEKIKDFPAVKHNKVIFNKEITRVIWEELINCRDQFPFRAECLLFMLVTGTRQSETLRIKKADVDINKNIITLQKAKSGKTEVVMITPAVIKVLRYLKDLENRESYQWSKFTPWLFSTTQFRVADFDYYKDTEKGQSYIQSENTQLGNPRDCWEYVRNQIRKNYPEFNGAPKNFRKNYSAAAVKILKNSSEAIKLTRHQLTSTLEKHYLGNNMEEIADNANLVSNNWFDFASNQ
jgi:integrase